MGVSKPNTPAWLKMPAEEEPVAAPVEVVMAPVEPVVEPAEPPIDDLALPPLAARRPRPR